MQCQYLRLLGLRFRRLLNRLLRNYRDDPALQAVLPLTEDERQWMSQLAPNGFPEPATVFERLDTNLVADDPQWPSALKFLEFNSVGVGCLDFMPVANHLIAEHVMPIFQAALGETAYQMSLDPRHLLATLLQTHAKAIGRSTCVVAFVERREAESGGADEMLRLSEFLKTEGLHAVCADPRELELRDGEVMHRDTVIDVVYRDFGLSEILSIEKHGGHVEAIKRAFTRNQVVSGLTGEFDHKSLFELFSNPEFERYFTPSQRRAHRAFVPWTRLVRERKTADVKGQEVDLPEVIRRQREGLVLKPNRAYGGQDVVIGMDVTQAAWEEALGRALAHPDTWVAQEMASLPQAEFLDPRTLEGTRSEFVTIGFLATPDGIAFIGRASPNRIVNISRGGSLVPTFLLR